MRRKTQLSFNHKLSFGNTRPKRSFRWVFALLTFPLLGGVLAYGLPKDVIPRVPLPTDAAPAPAETPAETPVAEAPAVPEPHTDRIDFVVRRDDTLERIFRALKLSLNDLTAILGVPAARQNLAQIKPGAQITVVHADGAVKSLSYRTSETETLSVARNATGFAAEVIKTAIEVKTVPAHATVDASLFTAARTAGVSPETMLQLANDVFGWEIDFALDIRRGDRFNLVYENKYHDGEYIGDGRILAAEFVNDGEAHRAVYYASSDGRVAGYFTPDGRSVRRAFLRTPLDFTRASLAFNPARPQPVLHMIRAHQGVDYVAPTGTIVKAAGDGRVSFAGENGDYGKVIIIDHGAGVSTLYAHLATFEKGLHNGQEVKQGDVIGTVGRTGAATGPHLHYEYRVKGTPTDPRTVKLAEGARIPAAYAEDFQTKAKVLLAEIERAPQTIATASPANAASPMN
ncbi:MAG: M23 family metallopeptidase [Sulfurifustaceae bacterium]